MKDTSRIELFSSTLHDLHEVLEECFEKMPLSEAIPEDIYSCWEHIRELFSLCKRNISTLFRFILGHQGKRKVYCPGIIQKQLSMIIMGLHYHSDYDYSSYVVPSRLTRVCFT